MNKIEKSNIVYDKKSGHYWGFGEVYCRGCGGYIEYLLDWKKKCEHPYKEE